MVAFLRDNPGFIYVIATLLPLAAFVLLLLAAGLRTALRSSKETGLAAVLYPLLGGDTPGKGGAYVATAAMALACLLSVYGFVTFSVEQADLHSHSHGHAGHEHNDGEEHPDEHAEHIEAFERRWSDHVNWASVGAPPKDEKHDWKPGTVLQLGYRIDNLSAVMFLMVTFISTLIFVFSIGYMSEELQPVVEDHQVHTEDGHLHRRGRFPRFFLFLSLFCFSMLNLVLADNLFQVFISWELVGICSYLLIGFYYERQSASTAANKAFITNRIGDAGFIIGLLILWTYLGTFNIQDIFKQVRSPLTDSHGGLELGGQIVRANPVESEGNEKGIRKVKVTNKTSDPPGSQAVLFPRYYADHYHGVAPGEVLDVTDNPRWDVRKPKAGKENFGSIPYWLLVAAGLGIFLGCVGKSAQFPLQVWLPDAMEGPTPVSALIHAATMVAAGVYLVGRVYPLFTPEALLVIAYVGAITLFVAATIALVMTDIKKVLAYSTVSQLGYMMLGLGVGGWVAGLFHLVTHAFFKALLFLGSGSVIYGCHHEQDMTKMGGLYPKMKITALTMLVGVLTIAGIPLFSGWYSKDAILAHAIGFAWVRPEHSLLFLLPLITAGITTFYMFRMWFLTFTGQPRDHHVHEHAHESPWLMTVPLIVLAVCSVGVAWGWPVWDATKSYLESHIHHAQHHSVIADFGHVPEHDPEWQGGPLGDYRQTARHWAHHHHHLAGNLALAIVALGIVFASLLYYFRVLDPAEAKEQFPGVHRFLTFKWYFDELYSVLIVRPGLVVATWCRAFDTYVIDGVANFLGRLTVFVSKWDGKFDLGIVDGLVNLTARVFYATGGWLRTVQTGYIRSYVLFLVLAVIGIFALLTYFVTLATAG